jgi:hypothetical protein
MQQLSTRQEVLRIAGAIQAYQKAKVALPRTLRQLADDPKSDVHAGEDGTICDSWGYPLVYAVRGNRFLLVSYGRDGKPGGEGVDCDLSNVNPRPPQSRLTFRQFIEFGDPTPLAAVSGILACLVALFTIRPADVTRQGAPRLIAKVLVTVGAAAFVGMWMAALCLPMGGH